MSHSRGHDEDYAEAQAMKRAMYEGVALGHLEIVGDRDGEPIFALTEKGQRYVESGFRDPEEPDA